MPKPKQSSLHDSLIRNLGLVHVIINFFVRCIHLFISFVYGKPLLQACFKMTKTKCVVYLPYHWICKTKQKVQSASKILWALWRMEELWWLSYKSRLQYDFGTVWIYPKKKEHPAAAMWGTQPNLRKAVAELSGAPYAFATLFRKCWVHDLKSFFWWTIVAIKYAWWKLQIHSLTDYKTGSG